LCVGAESADSAWPADQTGRLASARPHGGRARAALNEPRRNASQPASRDSDTVPPPPCHARRQGASFARARRRQAVPRRARAARWSGRAGDPSADANGGQRASRRGGGRRRIEGPLDYGVPRSASDSQPGWALASCCDWRGAPRASRSLRAWSGCGDRWTALEDLQDGSRSSPRSRRRAFATYPSAP